MKIKRNQKWINKNTGQIVTIKNKATGNRHWTLDNQHHIHEGTLLKFYKIINKKDLKPCTNMK
jgi:hypothetical protein